MKQIKKKLKDPIGIFRIALGIVFLFAALYRIFNYPAAVEELNVLQLSTLFIIPIISLEIIFGLLLLLNRFVKGVAVASIIFLASAITWGFVVNGSAIISGISKLFVFNPDATDILLHLIYMIILILIFINYKEI